MKNLQRSVSGVITNLDVLPKYSYAYFNVALIILTRISLFSSE
jgi:hypothetical protein